MKYLKLMDRRFGLAALFLFVSLGFPFYRSSTFLVWNDSPAVMGPDPVARQNHLQEWRCRHAGLATDPLGTLRDVLGENFGVVQPGGYRPLCDLSFQVTCWFSGESAAASFAHLTAVGAVYGALAVCLFLVARRFVQSPWPASFAVLLVLTSPPLAATSWIYRVGIQAMVPLLICLGLLCYWEVVEGRRRAAACAALCFLLIVAPWYREILFVLPLLIGFLEWERARRPTFLMYCALGGFLHALFPTALLKFLVYPDLPLHSMFALSGSVPAQLAAGGMRWRAANHFVPLLPPILWTVALLGSCLESWFELRKPTGTMDEASPRQRLLRLLRAAAPVAGLVATILVWATARSYFGLIFCLMLPLMAMQTRNAALAVWFLLLFVPLLRVFTEHIHFLYALVPAAIILARAVESLWLRLGALAAPRLRCALAGVCLLAASDQSMNLVGAYRTEHDTYAGIQKVAQSLRSRITPASIVIFNHYQGWEVLLHSDYYFTCYSTAITWDELERLAKNRGNQPVYFLDIDFVRLRFNVPHRHRFIHPSDSDDMTIEARKIETLHVTCVRYPFFDPLRYLVARRYVPFLGAPDLFNDFYCGRAQDASPFLYEAYAEYHLYEVTGDCLKSR